MHSKLHHRTGTDRSASVDDDRTEAVLLSISTPNGIRTRVTGVKGRRPRPLDDGGSNLVEAESQ